ncbi:MAG: energy-coupled thiamine transporter ThiT [Synergistaceae bacterium]|nr:energy-coupled thiamine transporter ThiT [Synergistaceae bacterium]
MQNRLNIKVMLEGALCIALAVVLDKLNLFRMPNGGSIDLELVPLIIFAWRHGLKLGLCIGALTGVTQFLLSPYYVHPIQVIADYPLATCCVGLSACKLFKNFNNINKILGIILAGACQIACHTFSGAVFFAQYAPAGQNPWIYSMLYNLPVMSIKYILSGIAAFMLYKALNKAFKF